jgi:hypothetical protein
MIRVLPLLTTLIAFTAFTASSEPAAPRLAVAPFAAASAGLPPQATDLAHAMLVAELKSTAAFSLVPALPESSAGAATEALRTARAAIEEARGRWAQKQLALADEALGRARAAYATAAPALTDIGELIDGDALAAAVAYAAGRDEDGLRHLTHALAMAPERPLPLAATSALFGRLVDSVRKTVQAAPKAALSVGSTPTHAPVTLDGQWIGSAPVVVRGVPPGPHLWSARLATGEAVGGQVELLAGRTTELVVRPARLDAGARLLAALARNQLDDGAVKAARELASATGADLVLFGALSVDGKALALDTFLLASDAPAPRRLARRQFDAELLSAGVELYALAGALAQDAAGVGTPVALPGLVAEGLTSQARPAEIDYAVRGADRAKAPAPDDSAERPRRATEPRRRVPLKTQ